MAGSSSFASRRVSPSRPIRRFTLAQANSTLPLVKRIVADIVRLTAEAAGLRKQIEHTTDVKKQATYQKDLDERAARIRQYDVGQPTRCIRDDWRAAQLRFNSDQPQAFLSGRSCTTRDAWSHFPQPCTAWWCASNARPEAW